jgi:hypothetical protein
MSSSFKIENLKSSNGSKLMPYEFDGTKSSYRIIPGILDNTFFLLVAGKKPYLNLPVHLCPLFYVQQPEYWEIEVVGDFSGILLPTITTYQIPEKEPLSLSGIIGKVGIELIWSDHSEKIVVR